LFECVLTTLTLSSPQKPLLINILLRLPLY